MDAKKIIVIAIVALVLVGAGLGAFYFYTQVPQPVDEMSLRVYADPFSENILQAINAVNYTAFSRDLDSAMKAAMTEQDFNTMCSTIQSKVGNYVSKSFMRGETLQGFTIAYYNATFTNEPAGVTVRVVFSSPSGPAMVSGIWFNSPKLVQ